MMIRPFRWRRRLPVRLEQVEPGGTHPKPERYGPDLYPVLPLGTRTRTCGDMR